MDKIKYTIIKNWLMSNRGNDYWTYNKYLERAKVIDRPWMTNMEVFLESPHDADGNPLLYNELIWLIRKSPAFNPHDTFMWYWNGTLHSANKVFPDLCDLDAVANFIFMNNDDLDDDELREILNKLEVN